MATIRPFKKIYLSQVSAEIPAGKPIIFWDTCSLIYIITIAVRDSFHVFQSYKDMLNWIENDDIVSMTSSIVWDEFNAHYNEERDNAVRDIDKLRELIRNYANLQTEPVKTQLNELANSINLIDILEDIETRVWNKTFVINEERQLAELAHYRVLHKMSPSMVKDQYKDAYIWCTFMSLASRLAGVRKFFITDNKEDYCSPKKSTNPQLQIKNDCNTVQAEILFNIGSLRGQVYQALHPNP